MGSKPQPEPDPNPAPTPTPTPGEDVAVDLLALHNKARAEAGVEPLVLEANLLVAAQKQADWMAARDSMTHNSYGSLGSRVLAAGYASQMVGENIAMGPAAPAGAVQLWLDSKPHRANMLRADYDEAGFAMAKSKGGMRYWCAIFGKPQGSIRAWSEDIVTHAMLLEPIPLAGPIGVEQTWQKPTATPH